MLVPTKPWDKVLVFYRGLERRSERFRPMRRLVEHVVAQPYSALLFCTTSMHALLVAQHAEMEWGHDVLRIECAETDVVRFTFQEQEFVKPATWQCPDGEIISTFEGFLRTSKWVARAVAASDS